MTDQLYALLFTGAVTGIASIMTWEFFWLIERNLFRSKVYHIQVLRGKGEPWWYWETVQTTTGGDFKFTYKEALAFKNTDSSKQFGNGIRIVEA